ncbi:tRNA preQ1(34) S-adenosylmethionine ribosyltransferase-isomerase QueA [Kordiimonas sp. SCSIO 12603]|uniref:tRNA preQ1(34) S-adenosylmethionine ribosyltransferase-isomerase QueA n=1 Tax=Kordiimonas sp. SCSIO 12603 TaxID=2829596 RepID=UPI002103FDBC|nr:tRNA preQ1(34) S-adenosylmethionine ribosyltransferase-isomerase QueA [Kordiimonas sp. SCSIO 12603]UTW57399.1 tRNA preQ1(34) S-adenosylmethionine ribosyltransferase-isomerase QueA [Kordiimonas sp. SCSIO 12603]
MNVELFNFDLPKENIALRPAVPRDSARMLVVNETTSDSNVAALANFLTDKDILVFNDTKVIPGRLFGKRGEAKIEVTLHKRESNTVWRVFARPAKKCRLGDELDFTGLKAKVTEIGESGERTIEFAVEDAAIWDALEAHGTMPLPPYIASQRDIDDQDLSDYQTVFAEEEGAVAAPTAGLHFTPELLASLEKKGVKTAGVTLHVGAGTFLPVKVDDTDDHKMHSEIGVVTEETATKLNEIRANGGRIVSVGTTSLRLLESAADDKGIIHPFNGSTDIFITPGYRFKAIDVLMTNFHLPKSTLFMLVSAFAGFERMKKAYATAIESGYRFYSYGDSSLLFPKKDEWHEA